MPISPQIDPLVREISEQFAKFGEVEAVVLAGSQVGEFVDEISDIDLYVYARKGEVNLQARRSLIKHRADVYELNNRIWETGDEWVETQSGVHVDVMYRDIGWIIDEIQRVMVFHQAQVGYSTCILYNILNSVALYDRGNWYSELQKTAQQPYPKPLAYAIVKKNHPILRKNMSSYVQQVKKALQRKDYVNVHNRLSAFVDSYFDVLFAINRMPHAGEKRMLDVAEANCEIQPPHLRDHIVSMLYGEDPIFYMNKLMDNLDDLLIGEGMLPNPIT